MCDIRSEVIKALPLLSEGDLSQLLAHLNVLGVEEPHDMTFLEENDLAGVLKVIQRRKLLNHFKAFCGPSSSWTSKTTSPGKSVPGNNLYYRTNSSGVGVSSSYVDFSRPAESGQVSYASTNAYTQHVKPETVTPLTPPPRLVNTVPSTVTTAPFKVSPAFTIPEHLSTSEDHSTPLQTFVTSNVASNCVPFNLVNDLREATPTTKAVTQVFGSVPTFQAPKAPSNVNVPDVPKVNTSSYRPPSRSYETPACELPSSNVNRSTESESAFSDYQLPMEKFPADIRKMLENKEQIRKPFSHEFVKVITSDLLSKCATPLMKEISNVAKAAVNAFPESLSDITSGRNNKPGSESLLNMIYNRINNTKRSALEKQCASVETEHLIEKRPIGRPKGKRSRTSDVSSPACSVSSSESVFDFYQIPLNELPHEIQDCLKHNKILSESSKYLVIQKVVDDLLKENKSITQETLKFVAKSVVTTYHAMKSARDISKSEMDFFQILVDEMKNRDVPISAKRFASEEYQSKNLTLNHKSFPDNPKIYLVPCDAKESDTREELTPFERWNKLRNYKVPLEKMPMFIRKDLKDGILIEDESRDEFIELIIHDALQIISKPNRDDLKVIAKAVVKAYPNSFQMRVKNNRFTYLGFLKKVMEIAVNITGNADLAFTTRGKKCSVPKPVRSNSCDSISGISEDEMNYYVSLKNELKNRSRNEEWSSDIADSMSTTFPLQRLEIKNGGVVRDLNNSWPFLFHEKGFLLHLRLLLGFCLKKKMEQNFRDKYNALLNYFVNQYNKQEDIRKVISEMMLCNNANSQNYKIVQLILEFFDEKEMDLLYIFQNENDDMRTLPSSPCIITFEKSVHPSYDTFSVCMQSNLLVRDVSFTTAFIVYFGTYLVFNLPYPPSLSHSLEFVQRCIAETPAREGLPVSEAISEKVDFLIKKTRFTGNAD